MKRGPNVRGKKKKIYVRGVGLVEVRENKQGILDAEGNLYERREDGSFKNVSLEENKDLVEVDLESLELYQEITLKDGTTWRNQPNREGKFELMLVAKPKTYTTLSPVNQSRYGKHSNNSK